MGRVERDMSKDDVRGRGARIGRLGLLAGGAVLVLVPILAGLVLAWQLHPLLVVPAYLLGIPVWLSVLSGLWSLVSRFRRSREAAPMPVVRSELRLPLPRGEQTEVRTLHAEAAPRGLRTPTP
jgi:hypothetical protein